MNGRECLLQLQRQFYSLKQVQSWMDFMDLPPYLWTGEYIYDRLLTLVPKYGRFIDEEDKAADYPVWDFMVKNQLLSPYEHPEFTAELLKISVGLFPIMLNLRGWNHAWVSIGTLPTGRINSVSFNVPNSQDKVIGIDTGLMMYLYLICKVMTGCCKQLQLYSDKVSFSCIKASKVAKRNADISLRFNQCLLAYLLRFDAAKAEQYFLTKDQTFYANEMAKMMEIFVICHEYGHLAKNQLMEALREVGVSFFEQFKENEEYLADNLGAHLALRYFELKNYDITMSYLGVDVFFSCLDLLEKCIFFIKGKKSFENATDSHPPAIQRRKWVRRYLKESQPQLAPENPERVKQTIELCNMFEEILVILWDKNQKVIKNEYIKRQKEENI